MYTKRACVCRTATVTVTSAGPCLSSVAAPVVARAPSLALALAPSPAPAPAPCHARGPSLCPARDLDALGRRHSPPQAGAAPAMRSSSDAAQQQTCAESAAPSPCFLLRGCLLTVTLPFRHRTRSQKATRAYHCSARLAASSKPAHRPTSHEKPHTENTVHNVHTYTHVCRTLTPASDKSIAARHFPRRTS